MNKLMRCYIEDPAGLPSAWRACVAASQVHFLIQVVQIVCRCGRDDDSSCQPPPLLSSVFAVAAPTNGDDDSGRRRLCGACLRRLLIQLDALGVELDDSAYWRGGEVVSRRRRLNLDANFLDDSDAWTLLGMTRQQFDELSTQILPDVLVVECSNRTKATKKEALAYLLMSLKRPRTLPELSLLSTDGATNWRRREEELCLMIRRITALIYVHYRRFIWIWPGIFDPANVAAWRRATTAEMRTTPAGAALANIGGALGRCPILAADGTSFLTSQPVDQFLAAGTYSGYERSNSARMLAFGAPCGLIVALSNVYGGHSNDLTMLYECPLHRALLIDRLRLLLLDGGRGQLVVVDSIFSETDIYVTTKQRRVSAAERARGNIYSQIRIMIEMLFGSLKGQFKGLEFSRMRWRSELVEATIFAAVFLLNCRTCLMRTSNVASQFDAHIPTLAHYLEYSHDAVVNALLDTIE